jgi:hypothetical protein
VEIRVNGVELQPDTLAPVKPDDDQQPDSPGFWIIVRNQAGWRRRTVNLQLGLIAPSHYSRVSDWSGVFTDHVSIDVNTRLHLLRNSSRSSPGRGSERCFAQTRINQRKRDKARDSRSGSSPRRAPSIFHSPSRKSHRSTPPLKQQARSWRSTPESATSAAVRTSLQNPSFGCGSI